MKKLCSECHDGTFSFSDREDRPIPCPGCGRRPASVGFDLEAAFGELSADLELSRQSIARHQYAAALDAYASVGSRRARALKHQAGRRV